MASVSIPSRSFSVLEDKYPITIQNAVDTVSIGMGIFEGYPCIMISKLLKYVLG
jgi:hypothetical protein